MTIENLEIKQSIDEINTEIQEIWDKIYPIGSIYMSVNSTNPSTLFGGKWSQLKDRFLLGVGDTYKVVNNPGGSTTHQHNFGVSNTSSKNVVSGNEVRATLNGGNTNSTNNTKVASGQNVNTNSALGNGQAWDYADADRWVSIGTTSSTSHLPPYLTVYMWKRTA